MSDVKILCCPFCGSDDNVVVDEIETGIIAICCDECKAIGPHTDGTHTVEQAIEKWNKAARLMPMPPIDYSAPQPPEWLERCFQDDARVKA